MYFTFLKRILFIIESQCSPFQRLLILPGKKFQTRGLSHRIAGKMIEKLRHFDTFIKLLWYLLFVDKSLCCCFTLMEVLLLHSTDGSFPSIQTTRVFFFYDVIQCIFYFADSEIEALILEKRYNPT